MHLYINQTPVSSHFKQTFNTSNINFFSLGMATPGFGLPEAYMARKLFMEKRKKSAREDEEKSTQMKISTIKGASEGKTASGCFSWVSNQHHKKISRISDCNHTQPADS